MTGSEPHRQEIVIGLVATPPDHPARGWPRGSRPSWPAGSPNG
jgi:hypothetical protein